MGQRLVVGTDLQVLDRRSPRADQPTVRGPASASRTPAHVVRRRAAVPNRWRSTPFLHPERAAGRRELPGEDLGQLLMPPREQLHDGDAVVGQRLRKCRVRVDQRQHAARFAARDQERRDGQARAIGARTRRPQRHHAADPPAQPSDRVALDRRQTRTDGRCGSSRGQLYPHPLPPLPPRHTAPLVAHPDPLASLPYSATNGIVPTSPKQRRGGPSQTEDPWTTVTPARPSTSPQITSPRSCTSPICSPAADRRQKKTDRSGLPTRQQTKSAPATPYGTRRRTPAQVALPKACCEAGDAHRRAPWPSKRRGPRQLQDLRPESVTASATSPSVGSIIRHGSAGAYRRRTRGSGAAPASAGLRPARRGQDRPAPPTRVVQRDLATSLAFLADASGPTLQIERTPPGCPGARPPRRQPTQPHCCLSCVRLWSPMRPAAAPTSSRARHRRCHRDRGRARRGVHGRAVRRTGPCRRRTFA